MQAEKEKGIVLLEILVAIAVAVILIILGTQLLAGSLVSNKKTAETDIASRLLEESVEAVKNSTNENWLNLYNLTAGVSNLYYPQISSGKWVLTSGTENIALNSTTYSRSFYLQYTCRNQSTKAITGVTDSSGTATGGSACTGSGGTFDPSTLKVTYSVSWPNNDAVTSSDYITRWGNKACNQTDWSSGVSGTTSTCPSTNYESKTNISATTDLQIQ